jgi:pyrimidine operon attenuation protein / uracil phosphoribosyltransferase
MLRATVLGFLFVLALHWGVLGGIILSILYILGHNYMEILLNADQITAAIGEIVDGVVETTPAGTDIAVIGLKSRGEILAQRICRGLTDKLGRDIPCGALDITLYRDDINDPHGKVQPTVRSTEIDFDVDDLIVILVDDVLETGRSIRAGMDALIDLGRPKAIRLAVLVDRGHRELPIRADYCPCKVKVSLDKSVEVNLIESDDVDQVVVSKA